ncbi:MULTISPECIES: hypothetical protein [unclassified Bartonella]
MPDLRGVDRPPRLLIFLDTSSFSQTPTELYGVFFTTTVHPSFPF